MATHSSTLAWEILWIEESGGLYIMKYHYSFNLHFLNDVKHLFYVLICYSHFLVRILKILKVLRT